jgi:DNA-binding NarL/FixJ family response regulator
MCPIHLDGPRHKKTLFGLKSALIVGMKSIRILVIDDHAMFRAGLALLLRMSIGSLEVVEAGSLDEALHPAASAPDLVLLDIVLRGLNGLDGIDLLKRQWPSSPIVMVSSDAAPHTVKLALARGANAFVSKEKTAENIVTVVRHVLAQKRGGLPSALGPNLGVAGASVEAARLTPRQLEVLDLLCQGLPNKAIGRKLNLTENTVRWHVQSILVSLNVSNRSEAAFAARGQGLIR